MKTIRHRLTLDIGGTFIKCSDGRSVPVNSSGTRDSVEASLREAVGDCASVDEIGVCIPGPFDYVHGVFLMKHKFASVYGMGFRELAGVPNGVHLSFVHDVVAPLRGLLAANPELCSGKTALVTLGTGLGFCYSVDGVVQVNSLGSPAVPLYNRAYRDGILEDYVSRRAILRNYGSPAEGDVKEISDRAHAGEPAALEAFRLVGEAFAEGAAPVLSELGIRNLYFGGQIAKSFSLMAAAVCKGLPEVKLNVIEDYGLAVRKGIFCD